MSSRDNLNVGDRVMNRDRKGVHGNIAGLREAGRDALVRWDDETETWVAMADLVLAEVEYGEQDGN